MSGNTFIYNFFLNVGEGIPTATSGPLSAIRFLPYGENL